MHGLLILMASRTLTTFGILQPALWASKSCRNFLNNVILLQRVMAESDGEEVWELSDEDSDLDSGGINIHSSTVSEKPPPNPEFQTNDSESQSSQSIVKWIVGFFFILQSKHHLPNSAIDFLIKFMAVLLYVLGKLSPLIGRIHKHFPSSSSLHVMRKRFADDINFHRYPIMSQMQHTI